MRFYTGDAQCDPGNMFCIVSMQSSVSVHIDLNNVKYGNVKDGLVTFVLGNDFLCFKLYITTLNNGPMEC